MTMRAAIVGLGWWGQLMVREARAKAPGMAITHGIVRNPDGAAAFAAEAGLVLSSDLPSVLARDDVDALIIASPHMAHVEQILAAAAAGKAVYTEKPLSLRLDQAEAAVAAMRDRGLLLGIGTDRRFLPAMRRLAQIVGNGDLGPLLHLEGQYSNDFMSRGLSGGWRMDESQSPGAGLPGPGLHALDAMIALAGPVARLSGQMTRPRGPGVPVDTVSLLLRFASGQSGTLGVVRGVPNYFRLAVYGETGWAEMRGFGTVNVCLSGGMETTETFPPDLAIGETMQIFAEAWATGTPFPVSPADMLVTQAAFSAALAALARPGWHDVPAITS
jgi:predicted dehydrogenase